MKKTIFTLAITLALTSLSFAQAAAPQVPARGAAPSKPAERALTAAQFAQLVERISEPGGYFDTDNLISNEASYLHVMGRLRKMNVGGGAYIGVGPDQNFSYIAQVRPEIAFITDIRRDNLLQHLLFKSLFALARNRLEFLCLLFGRAVPPDVKAWDARPIGALVEYLDKAQADKAAFEKTKAAVVAKVKSLGLTLKPEEFETIAHIHTAFFVAGLDLKFTSRGRGSRYYYPTYRDLLLEKDLTGKQGNYLVNEDDFKFLQSFEERNLLIPVVGNLAGEGALKRIAQYLNERSLRVSAFYSSNVEFYLMRGDDFERFAENVTALPRDERSVIIRSYFNGTSGYAHPQTVGEYYSTQLLQTMESFVKEHASGGYHSYSDIINKHVIDLR